MTHAAAAPHTGGIAGPLQSREDSLKRCSTTGSFGENLHDFSPAGRANGSSTQRYGLISGQIRTNQNWMLSLACPKIPACDKPG
uniref:Uncharacterized protein n=1 Tax=Nothobranchius pienaari TaxID=704102 RepID=A0A1A8LV23_9TELE